ncbi:xanthine dehydrogenase family protein molybdopterin-binding subunit [Falsiroseomonas oryzae]|uniref:xanthine dehydrogenase family protein molybdopterin-binding subunit n=1 Tax=Falsiroseomonas oryzae TaxID=2766473 RepID=UPI0022EA5426|nr:xanthine dehydrogenase family protein molybdopterin-binding subunit [Roseomonas sp. MO-31]
MDGIVDKFGIGQPVRRKEDVRFLSGSGRYTDDIDLPGQAQLAILRSPHAHARIVSLDVTAARAAPGVLLVLTGHDAEADGIGLFPLLVEVPPRPGTPPLFAPPRRILQTDAVRFVGDPVVAIVAETRAQAEDALELVQVEYDPLPSITETGHALDPDAPVIWPERGSNLCVDWSNGREEQTDAAFAQAAHVARIELVQNRVAGNPMEPRVAIGEWNADADRYELTVPSQGVFRVRDPLARDILKVPAGQLRVASPDSGGGFGLRSKCFVESAMVLWAAKKLARPVKWRAARSETIVADPHGRDHVTRAEMAFDANGKALGLRVRTLAGMGAYLSDFGPRVPTVAGARIAGTVYDLQAVNMQVRCVFTNTVPTDAYRGAGRPEIAYTIERLLDLGAAHFGLGREEIRRRNFVRPDQIPYTNCVGNVLDSGDFAGTQALALDLADWQGFATRRSEARARGKLRGIGIGYFIEASGGALQEWARLVMTEEGKARLHVGTFSHGQGHETAFAQIVHARLGIPFEAVELVQGDSLVIETGGGTGGSRSSQMGGVATLRASDAVLAKAKRIAAHLLEAAAVDVELQDGRFRVAGTDLAVSWPQVIAAAQDPARLPAGESPGLDEKVLYQRSTECNFPNGCHVAEVEIDPETGVLEVVRYAAVDDVGNVINPLLVHGQSHGGIAQGFGQAVLEQVRYDPESGQFLTATFMDYALPRAADLPSFTVDFNVVPTPVNELGVKGAGEGGACGAPPAIVSAACDALGVPHLDMPLTPEKIWRALRL